VSAPEGPDRSWRLASFRVEAIFIGLVSAAVLGFAGLFLLFGLAWGCSGSDASEPSTSMLCTTRVLGTRLLYVLGDPIVVLAVLAPLLASWLAIRQRRLRPLWYAFAAGVLAEVALYQVFVLTD
jgi:hypothetical protein